jgi:hypothetical protein
MVLLTRVACNKEGNGDSGKRNGDKGFSFGEEKLVAP